MLVRLNFKRIMKNKYIYSVALILRFIKINILCINLRNIKVRIQAKSEIIIVIVINKNNYYLSLLFRWF